MFGICVAAGAVGCSTVVPPPVQRVSETATTVSVSEKIPEMTWGSFGSDLMVRPFTQGPVDTYRPLYKVNESKKIVAKGVGGSEHEATENAIYNGCTKEGCDYIAAAQQLVRTFDKDNSLCFEVTVIGFPVTLTGVQTIKATFYEKMANGELKEMKVPEHRYILSNGTWTSVVLNGERGKGTSDKNVEVNEDKEVTVTHEEKETTVQGGQTQSRTKTTSTVKTLLGI